MIEKYYYLSGTPQLTVPAKVVCPDDGVSYIVKGIGECFCYNSDINSLTFSEGITTIECYTLWYCQSLETLVLPASLRAIGESPIEYCTNLKTILSKATEAPISANGSMFDEENLGTLYDQVTLYVPKGYQDAYANHTPWNQFSNIVEIDPNIALKKGVYLDKSKAVVKKKKTLTLKAPRSAPAAAMVSLDSLAGTLPSLSSGLQPVFRMPRQEAISAETS